MVTSQSKDFIKNAIYLSHTSLKDFLSCPRAYYLKNLYRDPETGLRIQIISPYLVLGSTVHDAIKWYLDMKGEVTSEQLIQKFKSLWMNYRGKRGGFTSREEEATFGKRGLKMLDNFFKNAKNLQKSAPEKVFPKYNLFENVVLIGNFDFVGDNGESLEIIDFKTGIHDEDDPIQLYIYSILAEANFGKPVTKAAFWYLDRDDLPKEIVLDSLEPKLLWLKEKAIELKKAVEENNWVCKNGPEPAEGCRDCKEYSAVIEGKGEFQFTDYKFKKKTFYLDRTKLI